MPLKERTLNLFSSLELLLPYLYKIKSGSSSLSFTSCFLPTNPFDNDFIRACISLTSSNIKYIDNQLVTISKVQMICKCKYKTI